MPRLLRALLAGFVAAALLAGCAPDAAPDSTEASEEGGSPARQTAFRVRTAFAAGLNADSGWAAGPSEPATVPVEEPFRLRFEVETPADAPSVAPFRLQVRRNEGDWQAVTAADFPYPDEATPRVSVVAAPSYADGDETTDVLGGSTAAYAGGAGVSLATRTPALAEGETEGGGQSEWAWPLVIRRYADGAVTTEEGDRFAFRLADAQGRPLPARAPAVVTATVPPRLLAGTFPETPGRIGPWQSSNGSLYFLMEPAETYNVLMAVKSADGGQTWQEVDGANRPATDDLEGLGSTVHDGTIHVLHQVDDGVVHHAFRMAGASGDPDAWVVRDDTVATPGEPPVQVATVAARSDGSLVGVYGSPSGLRYAIRSPEGTWGEEQRIPRQTGDPLSGPQAVRGAGDAVHLAYTRRDGTAWHRRILPDGSLSEAQQLASDLGTTEADVGAILPLVHLAESNTTVIVYRTRDGRLRERRVQADGTLTPPRLVTDRPVVQNAVDSDQAGADAVAIGGAVHVLFIDEASRHVYHTRTTDAGDAWSPATLRVEGVNAQWVRGQPVTGGGGAAPAAYGFVYDGGSGGGSGLNVYAEVPVRR